jgi:mannose-6-phosphate isomerase-like protein (cupin superfamily)
LRTRRCFRATVFQHPELAVAGTISINDLARQRRPPEPIQEAAMSQTAFMTKVLGSQVDAKAPDGSEVRLLLQMTRGSMAHFSLDPRHVSKAVAHQTIEEIWYFLRGKGRMWRSLGPREEVVDVFPGVSITIPTGTRFQFRNDGDEPLEAIGVTMPPWPGPDEAVEVEGIWQPDLGN